MGLKWGSNRNSKGTVFACMKLEMYSIEDLNEPLKSLPQGTNEAFIGKQSKSAQMGPKIVLEWGSMGAQMGAQR